MFTTAPRKTARWMVLRVRLGPPPVSYSWTPVAHRRHAFSSSAFPIAPKTTDLLVIKDCATWSFFPVHSLHFQGLFLEDIVRNRNTNPEYTYLHATRNNPEYQHPLNAHCFQHVWQNRTLGTCRSSDSCGAECDGCHRSKPRRSWPRSEQYYD